MDDLISRQAAIDALADYIHNVDRVIGTGNLSADDCKDAAISVLADLPSADRPQGKWEIFAQGWHAIRRCSNCKWTQTYSDSKYMGYKYNFCPSCGADMRGE